MFPYILLLVVLLLLISYVNSPNGKGMIGEWRVNKILKKQAIRYGGIELSNFMFEDDKSSSQIDNMLLTQKALYVIEVKNYNGHIFGNEENMNWTVTVKHVNKKKSRSGKVYKKTNISKHQFYNPLKQNRTH
ncbi:MAG: NERD domain-containing protein, partial [Firmicutes bacterium]|nr:NERD domain-containing protein [Bacillota bacterium]